MAERETTARTADRPPTTDARPPDDDPNTLLNAVVGAVVTVVTAPALPFAAIAGGGVAGYLQGTDLREGATVGAVSGAIATIPAFLFAWVVAGFLLIGMDPFLALSSLFAVFLFVLVAGYLVGAGAVGGALGAYLRREL
ncbi:DUF5518 domain-containing protein [Halorussus gelatinilyticus]|uniref:DUF5518 domain-containing protein n=1 Tax=Halorussus gelatinilyticus TaxID=2937524 RepID=A0A8U0IMU0_9EURY|nr:DUF5518 domain-containing protein [Halorussus gelatinilyticus]UPW01752.1 DUF5518 domain-containing protein [Halorussus gelatinilyticus]